MYVLNAPCTTALMLLPLIGAFTDQTNAKKSFKQVQTSAVISFTSCINQMRSSVPCLPLTTLLAHVLKGETVALLFLFHVRLFFPIQKEFLKQKTCNNLIGHLYCWQSQVNHAKALSLYFCLNGYRPKVKKQLYHHVNVLIIAFREYTH